MTSSTSSQCKIIGRISPYKIHPEMIYRAGCVVDSMPKTLPLGSLYTKLESGKYARFILTGTHNDLPAASGRVFDIVNRTEIKIRDAFYIENYVTDPKTSPDQPLVTEILIPTV